MKLNKDIKKEIGEKDQVRRKEQIKLLIKILNKKRKTRLILTYLEGLLL